MIRRDQLITAGPVTRLVAAVLIRRRVQTIAISLVLAASTAASVLAAALLVDSRGSFVHVFAAQQGADVTVTADLSRATVAQLAATAHVPGVTAAAGPFAETTVRLGGLDGTALEPMTLAGRTAPGGPVDDLTLVRGHWAQRAGQVVLQLSYHGGRIPVGSWITVTGLPGAPRLQVVGLAVSVTGSADAWAIPAQVARLRSPGTPASAQMLYRFRSAATSAAVRADIAAVTAALPAGTVTATASYLTVKATDAAHVAAYVPVLITCGVIGLVLSLLIVVTVIRGAVAAGPIRIGVLKVLGFSPGQVTAAYAGPGLVPATAGCLGGVALGHVLADPLLAGAAPFFGTGVLGVPAWVDVNVAVATCSLIAIAALVPAARAAKTPAASALRTGLPSRRVDAEASGFLVVPPVFKTGGRRAASSAGSIPVRLRCQQIHWSAA